MRKLNCRQVEIYEVWGFIGKKRRNVSATDSGVGDVWTFIALDTDSKLIPSFLVGKRDSYHAKTFINDLASRVTMRIQLSSDSLNAYADAVERGFGANVDYGQISKTYSVTNLTKEAAGLYSPADVVKVEKTVVSGMPDVTQITTSHIEKQNHTLRMHCRRLTRLTNVSVRSWKTLRLRFLSTSRITTSARFTAQSVALRRWPLAWKRVNGALRNLWNAVANKEYIQRLQMVIHQLHGCDSAWLESVPVHEVFRGETVWKGLVEVFTVSGHPKAQKAYAWSHPENADGTGERFVAVLEIPPVKDAVTAVRASIVADAKNAKGKKRT